MMKNKRRGSRSLYSALILLIVWQVFHVFMNTPAIPSPIQTLWHFIFAMPSVLSLHLVYSLGRVIVAMILSAVVGSGLGIWIGSSEKADYLLTPVVYMLYPIPKIAFLPILMILLGLGEQPKILLIILIIVFQFTMAARDGLREIPKELVYSVESLGIGWWDRLKHLVLPSILPKILTTVRISMGAAISVLFFAENFATTYGIGYYIMNQWAMINYREMFSGIIALSIAGYFIYKGIDWLDKRICPWMHLESRSNTAE